MIQIDYKEILNDALARYGVLALQRDEISVQMTKQLEFIGATINMLSEEDARKFKARLAEAVKRTEAKDASLTESVRDVLRRAQGKFLTTSQVRDQLVNSGFDFSGYMSNPLASVSTTLRRMKPEEVEAADIRGVAAFKWIGPLPKFSERRQARLESEKARDVG